MTSKADAARYTALHAIGCIACLIGAVKASGVIEMHHLVDKGTRKLSGGNKATIPLCDWHHRGVPHIAVGKTYMRERFGPSMALEGKEFAKVYGSQRELLARVNGLISGKIRRA